MGGGNELTPRPKKNKGFPYLIVGRNKGIFTLKPIGFGVYVYKPYIRQYQMQGISFCSKKLLFLETVTLALRKSAKNESNSVRLVSALFYYKLCGSFGKV